MRYRGVKNLKTHLPMEDFDHDKLLHAISEDDELLMREVFQGDHELFLLHHYLTDVLREGDI